MKRAAVYIFVVLLMVSLVLISCTREITGIQVATNASYPPFSSIDKNINQMVGFDIDLIKAIAQKEKLTINLVNNRFDLLLEGIAKGQYDVAIGAISITDKRKKDMLFSDPYYTAGHVVTIRTENTTITGKESLTGKVVGSQTGTTSANDINDMTGVTAKHFTEYSLAFQALLNSDIDAVVSDNTIANTYIAMNPGKLKLAGAPFTQEQYGIAVNKNKPELLLKINAGLKTVKSAGLIEELSKKWIPSSNVAPETLMSLERTACKGKCPVYKLTISGNGKVVYEGKDFVQTLGIKETTISPEKINQLVTEFDKINYFSLKDSYTEVVITDFPLAITSITIGGKTKSIKHYQGDLNAPKELKELENKIDEIANAAQWIK